MSYYPEPKPDIVLAILVLLSVIIMLILARIGYFW